MDQTFFGKLGTCKNLPLKAARVKRGCLRPRFEFQFDDRWKFSRKTSPSLHVARDCGNVPFDGDFVALAKQAHRPLYRLEADFAWLALAVYLADRFAPRYPYGANGSEFWRRRIHLQIPVSTPHVFENACAPLVQALEFLTEDDWSFEFVPGRVLFEAESQGHMRHLRGPKIAWASLFSGGLDSLAGALLWLQRTHGVGLLISGQTNNRIAAGQDAQVHEMRECFPQRIEHFGIAYGVPDKHKSGLEGFESSQRTRAFVHTGFGSLAALMNGCPELFLFENGFGALNLPCDSAQFGSQNSRGTHPMFLRRMAAFVSAVFSQPFVIVNPFMFSTKSQMVAASGMSRFAALFQKSFSCDHYPNYHHKVPQCGYCASCLVRRLSLYSAGLPDGGGNYSTDVFHPRRGLRETELLALTKLTAQAGALATTLRDQKPWAALCSSWPDLLRTEIELSSPAFREGAIALLRRHVAEWQSFSSAIHPESLALAA